MLRTAGLALHRCFTWNRPLARAYAGLWQRSLAHLPEGALRDHLRNNLLGARWPDNTFSVQTIRLCEDVVAKFEPVPGSLPYRKGLFRDRLAHEPEVFTFLCARAKRYDAVVEIGANIGAYTVMLGQRLPRGRGPRVFSFEPWPRAWRQLQRHIELNDLDNIRTFNQAVGPPASAVKFYENELDWMKGSIDVAVAAEFPGYSRQPIRVTVASGAEITGLVSDFQEILVKVDVVGAEAAVIAALEPLLSEKTPEMIVGVSRMNGGRLDALTTLRKRYQLFRIGSGGLSPRETFNEGDYCNYFLARR